MRGFAHNGVLFPSSGSVRGCYGRAYTYNEMVTISAQHQVRLEFGSARIREAAA